MTTEVMEERTTINRRAGLSAADEERIREAVCRALRRPFVIAAMVLVLIGVVQAYVLSGSVSDLRTDLSNQRVEVNAARDRISASEAVRRSDMDLLTGEVREIKRSISALTGTLAEVRRTQDRLDGVLNILSAAVTSNTAKVSEEQAARRELMEAMGKLGAQLRAR